MSAEQIRVLVVDQDAELSDSIAEYLRDVLGYIVDIANNSQESLARSDVREDYDVALIGDMLISEHGGTPRSNGLALVSELKERSPHLGCIFITTPELGLVREALRAGADSFIPRPVDKEALGMLIERAAERHRLKTAMHEKRLSERLPAAGPAIQSAEGVQLTLDTILQNVQQLGFDRVRLYMLSEDRANLIGWAHVGMDSGFVGLILPIDQDNYMQTFLADPQPHIFQRAPGQALPYEHVLAKENVLEWACVPLLTEGQIIGKLSVDNKLTQRPIDAAALRLAALFATLAAAASENARLRAQEHEARQEAEERLRNIEAIQKLSVVINSLRSLDEILEATCRAAYELFNVEHSGLVRFTPDYRSGHVVAEYPNLGARTTEIPVRGVSLEERLIERWEPIVVSDVAELAQDSSLDPLFKIFDRFNICSILIVPVVYKDHVWGSFSLDAIGHRREFSPHQIDLCKIFAAQVATAVENAQLFAVMQQRVNELETIGRTALAVTSAQDRDTLLKTIIQQAVGLLKAKSGGIYEYYPERGELLLIADHSQPGAQLYWRLRVGEGMAGRLVESKDRYIIVNDYNSWPGRSTSFGDQRSFGAVIEVPLLWQGNMIGVLYVDDQVGRTFTEADAELLMLFADHAAMALGNANLSDKDASKLRRLELLSRASDEIMGNLGTIALDERLRLIARHAVAILGAEACSILLVRRPGVLSFEASYGYREGAFKPGKEFLIRSGPRLGLTGHIAYNGELFNSYGNDLTTHFAVRGQEPSFTLSGRCYSLLAIPLRKGRGSDAPLVGLLRLDNKKDRRDEAGPGVKFTQEDEWLIRLFADVAVVAIEAAELVAQLSEQKDHLARLVASSPIGVIDIDQDGHVKGINTQAQGALKYQLDDLLGKSASLLYDDPAEAAHVEALLHEADDGKLEHYESVFRSKDGVRVPIRLAATWLYDARGTRIGSVSYFEDLRSIKEMEQRLALLLKASQIVSNADHLRDGLQKLAEMLGALLGAAFCRIFLLDESEQFLVAEAVYPLEPGALDWRSGLDERTALTEWPDMPKFLAEDGPKMLSIQGRRSRALLEEWARRLGLQTSIQSMLVIPLRTNDRVVGLLDLAELYPSEPSIFSPEKQELAGAIASQTAVLIDRARLHQSTARREELLVALNEASRNIRAEKEPSVLLQAIVRLAADMVGCTAGGLYINSPHLEELELKVTYNLPEQLIGSKQSHAEGLIGLVARTCAHKSMDGYARWPERETVLDPFNFNFVVGVPLKLETGEVEAVLFVAAATIPRRFSAASEEILERFAAQAAIALKTSRLITQEQRLFSHLAILHTISDYIQSADELQKILGAVLTGVTAWFGLGFNRAALMLLDERREYLVGRMGIGNLLPEDAYRDWAEDRERQFDGFKQVREVLDRNKLPLTPVGERIQGLRLPLQSDNIFTQLINTRQWRIVEPEQLAQLPESFRRAFEPSSPLVIVLLIARSQVLGLLAADNKFTQAPITTEIVDSLQTFADTAALAIYNKRLLEESETAREKLHSFYAASSALVSSQDPAHVLQDIVEQAWKTAGASGVSMVLVDETGYVRSIITAGSDRPADVSDLIRPNGISVEVLLSGQFQMIEDVDLERERVNPSMFWRGVRAALCLPVSFRGERKGVMWIHYGKPRHFSRSEVDALQLYVNQAAIAYEAARRIKELEHMRQAAEALAGAASRQQVLEQIVLHAQTVLEADLAVVWSYDETRNALIPANTTTADGLKDRWDEFQKDVPRPGGTAATIMQQGWVGVEDVNDTERFPYLGGSTRKLLERIGAQSFQGITLSVGVERLGLLYLNYNRPRIFSDGDRKTAETFANHAALALKNAQLVELLSKARDTARVVAEVTVLQDLQRTLYLLAERTMDVLGCDAVTMYVYDERTSQLSHRPITLGLLYPERVSRLPDVPKDSIVFEMLNRDKLYAALIVSEDPLFQHRRFAREEHIATCVAIPLKVSAERVGVIFVNYRVQHRFTEDERDNMELFANQAAVAIQNAQLYAAARKPLAALELAQSDMVAGDTDAALRILNQQLHSLQQAYDALIEQDQRKTEFLAIVSHELRTPLWHMLSCIENLISGMYDPLTERQHGRLMYGLIGAHEQERLITNFLDLGRIQAGPLELDLKRSSVVKIIRDIVNVVDYDARLKQIELDVQLPPEDSLEVLMDILRIKGVIVNLIDNALKFTDAGGRITLIAQRRGDEIEVTVSDTGCGIPDEEQPKVFDRFYQIQPSYHEDSSGYRPIRGAGIGLNIAKEYIRLHGGRIWVVSTVGEGSTFGFTLKDVAV